MKHDVQMQTPLLFLEIINHRSSAFSRLPGEKSNRSKIVPPTHFSRLLNKYRHKETRCTSPQHVRSYYIQRFHSADLRAVLKVATISIIQLKIRRA